MPLLCIVCSWLSRFKSLCAMQQFGRNPEPQICPKPFQLGGLCQLWFDGRLSNKPNLSPGSSRWATFSASARSVRGVSLSERLTGVAHSSGASPWVAICLLAVKIQEANLTTCTSLCVFNLPVYLGLVCVCVVSVYVRHVCAFKTLSLILLQSLNIHKHTHARMGGRRGRQIPPPPGSWVIFIPNARMLCVCTHLRPSVASLILSHLPLTLPPPFLPPSLHPSIHHSCVCVSEAGERRDERRQSGLFIRDTRVRTVPLM